MKNVKLLNKIVRGEQTISEVALRTPDTGALRGLKLTDLLQMDVNAVSSLLPRITEPALLPSEIATMAPADFMSLAGRVVGFFLSADQQAQLEVMDRPR